MDVALGQTTHRQMVVMADMVAKYAEITGDYNPLHFDEEFAGQTRFKRLICQGGKARLQGSVRAVSLSG